MRAVSGGDADTVRVLLAKGKPDLEAAEESGATALHIAAGDGQVELVRLLLAAGADPAARNAEGRTPADVAAKANHADAAALLRAG
jgi:ankyrin repeat protein